MTSKTIKVVEASTVWYLCSNSDKVYSAQILKDTDKPDSKSYSVITQWGRRDRPNTGQSTLASFVSFPQARAEMIKKINSKVKKGYNRTIDPPIIPENLGGNMDSSIALKEELLKASQIIDEFAEYMEKVSKNADTRDAFDILADAFS